MDWELIGKLVLFGILGGIFIKDFLIMPYVIGEAKTKKDYFKTFGIGVIVIALIFLYSFVMGELF